MFLRRLMSKRVLIPILIFVALGLLLMPKRSGKITIVEVEDGKPAVENELVFFEVDKKNDTGNMISLDELLSSQQDISKDKMPQSIYPQTSLVEGEDFQANQANQVEIVETENLDIVAPEVKHSDEYAKPPVEVRLEGVLYDQHDSIVILEVDGEDYLLKLNESVSGVRIAKITKNQICVEYSGKSYIVRVGEAVFLNASRSINEVSGLC